MKKIISTLCILTMMISFSSCGKDDEKSSKANENTATASNTNSEITSESNNISQSEETETTEGTKSVSDEKVISASNIMQYFIDNNAPNIGKYVEYDEKTDPKNLLGRPNQYTSMLEFEITTVDQYDKDRPSGGVIEVFENEDDVKARYDYLQSVIEQFPAWNEYEYINGTVILRIDLSVTPSDEKVYEQLLDAYMEN